MYIYIFSLTCVVSVGAEWGPFLPGVRLSGDVTTLWVGGTFRGGVGADVVVQKEHFAPQPAGGVVVRREDSGSDKVEDCKDT